MVDKTSNIEMNIWERIYETRDPEFYKDPVLLKGVLFELSHRLIMNDPKKAYALMDNLKPGTSMGKAPSYLDNYYSKGPNGRATTPIVNLLHGYLTGSSLLGDILKIPTREPLLGKRPIYIDMSLLPTYRSAIRILAEARKLTSGDIVVVNTDPALNTFANYLGRTLPLRRSTKGSGIRVLSWGKVALNLRTDPETIVFAYAAPKSFQRLNLSQGDVFHVPSSLYMDSALNIAVSQMGGTRMHRAFNEQQAQLGTLKMKAKGDLEKTQTDMEQFLADHPRQSTMSYEMKKSELRNMIRTTESSIKELARVEAAFDRHPDLLESFGTPFRVYHDGERLPVIQPDLGMGSAWNELFLRAHKEKPTSEAATDASIIPFFGRGRDRHRGTEHFLRRLA